jgi:hypothetical protein
MRKLMFRTLSLASLALVLACDREAQAPLPGIQAMSFANSDWSAPVNLGPAINSTATDNHAAISKDGLSLYFASNRVGGVGNNDVWVSQRDCADCPWETPLNVAVLNSPASDVGPELSDDERLLFFSSARPRGAGDNDIYVSRRANPKDNLGWEAPERLGTDVNTAAAENMGDYLRGNIYFNRQPLAGTGDLYYAPVTRDGETLGPAALIAELSDPVANDVSPTVRFDEREVVFASNRAGSVGLNDIWTSSRRSPNDPWSTPENVGIVNSVLNELTPSLSPDGRILLFDSDRPGGVGGRDLYMSTRTPSGKEAP